MKLFVSHFGLQATAEDLKAAFLPYGKINDVFLFTEPGSGRSRGFAIVEFEHAAEAESAITGLHGTGMDGLRMRVKRAGATALRSAC